MQKRNPEKKDNTQTHTKENRPFVKGKNKENCLFKKHQKLIVNLFLAPKIYVC